MGQMKANDDKSPVSMPQMAASFTLPVCSKEYFAENTGFSERYVQLLISEGYLPILPKKGRSSKVLINLEALRMQCQSVALVSR
ncbi:hypothetical protein [Aeromonas dhakensis]|uniref:Uncharacterized protein n=1 Tax=Aeromonas dhakensis TaxID=196024 RepID=K1JDL4_9GAMM|nr:hypothetical protein [Aeromonas dhakensis]EKB25937.1 hypothetical protein HMPREF1171_04227 [Aeromonas dhakensis]